jgi:hypothetical protein
MTEHYGQQLHQVLYPELLAEAAQRRLANAVAEGRGSSARLVADHLGVTLIRLGQRLHSQRVEVTILAPQR